MTCETRDTGDAVVATGYRNPAIAQSPKHHAERERNHEEVDVANVGNEQSERRAEQRADDESGDGAPEQSGAAQPLFRGACPHRPGPGLFLAGERRPNSGIKPPTSYFPIDNRYRNASLCPQHSFSGETPLLAGRGESRG